MPMNKIKTTDWIKYIALFISLKMTAYADLIISGVVDGDLSGGNPKGIFITALNDISDLSSYGVGSANNGKGTNGQEFGFSGSILSGQILVVTTSANEDFFANNFPDNNFIILYNSSAPLINGDDAIELFSDGEVIDTFGDINIDGTGEPWEYKDGYAVRIGGEPGEFKVDNYSFSNGGLDTLDEAGHASTIASLFKGNPSEPLEELQITDIFLDRKNNTIVVSWPSVSGRTYALEVTTELISSDGIGVWQEFDDNIPGEEDETSYDVALNDELSQKFFIRVRDNTE